MSGSKCNWHLDSLELPETGDPMAEIEELKSEAKVIDLGGDRPELMDRLVKAMDRENGFSVYANLECDLKWSMPGPTGIPKDRNPCYDCPHYTEDGEHHARALLCALGREQNDILDALYAIDALKALDAELTVAHGVEVGASEELAAALL